MSQLFTSGGQSAASASVLPMNIQDWLNLGLTGLIFLLSKGLSRVFSNTTVQKHQFFDAQPSLCHELPDVQAGFRKGRETGDQIASICWIIEQATEFQKNIYFCFIDNTKAFDFVAGKFLKLREYQTTLPSSWEICMQVKNQWLELVLKQQTGSKLEKEYIKAAYCHPA